MSEREGLVFSVSIETWGEGPTSVDDEALAELSPMLGELGATGVAASAGGLAGGPGATFSLLGGPDRTAIGEVVDRAVGWFEIACEKVRLHHGGIARVDVMSWPYLERLLSQEPESYLGVSELAAELHVSRQRVSELRTREDFPAPVANLAAGPVWKLSNLKRFLAEWPRKPGRPQTWKRELERRGPPDADALRKLTEREREVLSLLTNGASTREIAERIGVSDSAVRSSVRRILDKLNVHSRLEASRDMQ